MAGKVAIVILNYNGEGFLEKFLPSVIQHSKSHRIIVADNASTDHSIQLLERKFPEVELLLLDKNHGFAGGYNEALRQVKEEYYLLLNSDVEVTPGWIEPMLQLLESRPEVAACQPKVLSYHLPSHFEHAGAAGGFLDVLAYPFCRGRIFNTLEEDAGQYDEPAPIFWATGACMLLRSHIFHRLGGFDKDFFAHMEEIDLCWRIHNAGLQVYAIPQSLVYHVGGGTLPKINPRKTFLNFRNNLWMLYKNSTTAALWWKLPLRHLLDWLAAFTFLFQGKGGDFLAVWQAQLQFWKQLPVNKRKKVQKLKQIGGETALFKSSILWKYHIQGIRTYEKLTNKEQKIRIIQNAG
jgi:GT2 family glycosyltransferase